MSIPFEVRYINIKWDKKPDFSKDLSCSVKESYDPIEIEVIDEIHCLFEVQVYTRLDIDSVSHGRIAFHFFDPQQTIIPKIQNAQNEWIDLQKITDQNKKTWYIVNGPWNSDGYLGDPLWNHVGEAKILVGDITCSLNVSAESFDSDELQLYLDDFKNDFWRLILLEDAYTQGDAQENQVKVLNLELLNKLKKFFEVVENVLKNPKKELKEIQILRDSKKIRPVPRTFMEISTGGIRKKLTSRDYLESYNVAENKYVHYIVAQIYSIVSLMVNAINHKATFISKHQNYNQKRLQNLSERKTTTINERALNNTIRRLEEALQDERTQLEKICISDKDHVIINSFINKIQLLQNVFQHYAVQSTENIELDTIIIKLENRKNDYQNEMQFSGKVKSKINVPWHEFKNSNDFFIFSFDKSLFEFILKENEEYQITASIQHIKVNWAKGTIYKIYFRHISDMKELNAMTYKTLIIKLNKKKLYRDKITSAGHMKMLDDKEWHIFRNKDFYSLKFDEDIGNILKDGQEYKITAYIENSKREWNNQNGQGTIHRRYFKYVEKIELLSSKNEDAITEYKYNRNQLEQSNWEREMTPKEMIELENEKNALKHNLLQSQDMQKNVIKEISHLKLHLKQLKKLVRDFENFGIKKSSHFPNSMTFVQNPNYQASHKLYREIMNLSGIDESLFLYVMNIEKIGLLDMPKIYERWCLLQIIKVIIDKYNFIPNDDWKKKLVEQVLGNKYNISLKFTNQNIKREITLWYEKELKNNKRPDFVMDVALINDENSIEHRFVMDAKFYENINSREHKGITNILNELYNKKDYSENEKNKVFILHPDKNHPISESTSSAQWFEDSYYGEAQMFDWDNKNPDHKYGAIFLSPVLEYGNYLDNLQRLIGMFLQYGVENNTRPLDENGMIDPIPKGKSVCIVCGSNNLNITKYTTAFGKGYRYDVACTSCKHIAQYNYCSGCKNRLIKHGEYWNYHATQVLNPWDIRCPVCGDFTLEGFGGLNRRLADEDFH